jgi:TusE/DsrC/DsvC family sulfur relay protein
MTTTQTIAGTRVELDPEGSLVDPAQWTEEIAVELAHREGIETLTDRHWRIIRYMRTEYETKGAGPPVRALSRELGVPIKELYELFPKGPAKLAAKLAGIPKPRGCI